MENNETYCNFLCLILNIVDKKITLCKACYLNINRIYTSTSRDILQLYTIITLISISCLNTVYNIICVFNFSNMGQVDTICMGD